MVSYWAASKANISSEAYLSKCLVAWKGNAAMKSGRGEKEAAGKQVRKHKAYSTRRRAHARMHPVLSLVRTYSSMGPSRQGQMTRGLRTQESRLQIWCQLARQPKTLRREPTQPRLPRRRLAAFESRLEFSISRQGETHILPPAESVKLVDALSCNRQDSIYTVQSAADYCILGAAIISTAYDCLHLLPSHIGRPCAVTTDHLPPTTYFTVVPEWLFPVPPLASVRRPLTTSTPYWPFRPLVPD